MEKGHSTYQSGDFWRELANRLDPTAPGRGEKAILAQRILSRAGQAEMIAHLKDALIAQGGVRSLGGAIQGAAS